MQCICNAARIMQCVIYDSFHIRFRRPTRMLATSQHLKHRFDGENVDAVSALQNCSMQPIFPVLEVQHASAAAGLAKPCAYTQAKGRAILNLRNNMEGNHSLDEVIISKDVIKGDVIIRVSKCPERLYVPCTDARQHHSQHHSTHGHVHNA